MDNYIKSWFYSDAMQSRWLITYLFLSDFSSTLSPQRSQLLPEAVSESIIKINRLYLKAGNTKLLEITFQRISKYTYPVF